MIRSARRLLVPAAVLLLSASAAAATEKTAADAMKNVQVLKDVPLSTWDETMGFISNALGVDCQYCHTANAFEKDDRKAKQTARSMILMTRELNQKSFAGRAEVTCFTCHQGNVRPKGMPPLWTKTEKKEPPAKAEPPAESLPDADQVFARYRKAVGAGEPKSIRLKGVLTPASRPPVDAEIELFPPDKLHVQASIGGQQIRQFFDGDRGWTVAPTGVIQMTPANLVNAKRMQESLLQVKFAVPEGPRKTVGTEKIGDRTYTVLESHSERQLERLYFDTESGLLFRRYTEIRTPLGTTPLEMSFEDYRAVGGVKLPYRITILSPKERAQYTFSEIQINVPLDPARFTPPRL